MFIQIGTGDEFRERKKIGLSIPSDSNVGKKGLGSDEKSGQKNSNKNGPMGWPGRYWFPYSEKNG